MLKVSYDSRVFYVQIQKEEVRATPCNVQRAETIFLYYIFIEIQTNVLARSACGYDIVCETAKSQAKYPHLHIYVSL